MPRLWPAASRTPRPARRATDGDDRPSLQLRAARRRGRAHRQGVTGRRSASVKAIEPGKVLVLRRHFLRELMRKDPTAAAQVLYNLAKILADRLNAMVQERQLSTIADDEREAERVVNGN